jgi:hypothetical protein
MAAPHNPKRYGELWDNEKLKATLKQLEHIKSMVVLSGGWAWHFISPQGHAEYKHAHDHKDVDVFVEPNKAWSLIAVLHQLGFAKESTRHDSNQFQRYTSAAPEGKIVLDIFVDSVPCVEANGFLVVEPSHLLSLYNSIHTTDNCWAVKNADKLLQKKISPINHPAMIDYGEWFEV